MNSYSNHFIKQIPVLRFLVPLIIGILLQYHYNLSLLFVAAIAIVSLAFVFVFSFLSSFKQLKFSAVKGILLFFVFLGIGACLSYTKNIEHSKSWVGNYFSSNTPCLVTLQENIVAKEKSNKALATVNAVYINNKWQCVDGDVLLYFKKDSTLPKLHYGSQLVIKKNLINIVNSGNPSGFNYAQYCSFQGIHYQGFLKNGDYVLLPSTQEKLFATFLINIRTWVLQTLKTYIHQPNELSIAEALLIGYRDELDRDLVKAYSNTGVVHIIAISGLHLGMIYGLILFFFKPFDKFSFTKYAKPITIIIVLWLFSFLAGLAPSILRSAIMFTCIAIGSAMGKRSNIYNGLALSALIILLINPFSLWDVGFQLSYSAVLSIIVFSGYIKNWLIFKNKWLNTVWELCAVTLSAQILTLPIVLYHFHQFANYFFITNLIAVPLSGLILYGEIFLLITSWLQPVAAFIGIVVEKGIALMNAYILWANDLPYSLLLNIQISIPQAIILFISIVGLGYWLMNKNTKAFFVGLCSCCLFLAIRCADFYTKTQQQKIIVYNVPNHTAIDVINGRKFNFIGDSILNTDGFLRNFHINPSRVLHRISETQQPIFTQHNNFICANNKTIAIVDKPLPHTNSAINVDAVVITQNPKLYIKNLVETLNTPLIIFDGSNSTYKINYWKKDCDSLHIPYYICAMQGAYIFNLQ